MQKAKFTPLYSFVRGAWTETDHPNTSEEVHINQSELRAERL
jgi:hypothetical protein